MSEQKRFDDFHAECNDCTHYWNGVCDGVKPNDTRPCNSFQATRQVDIPDQIKRLDRKVKSVQGGLIFIQLLFLIHLISHIFF